MKKLAIIPARFDSSRFPGKPLIDLAGKTMIQRVVEGVITSQLFDDVVVATDDERIVKEVQRFEGKAVLTSSSHQSGTDRCGEVIQTYADFDVVVNVQGDEPLVNKEQLQILLTAFEDNNVEIATLGNPHLTLEDYNNSNRIKIVVNHKNQALYFSRSPIPFVRKDNNYPFLKHIGLYGFKTDVLHKLVKLRPSLIEETESLEQLRWLYYGYQIKVMSTTIETPNIDTPEDVIKVLDLL